MQQTKKCFLDGLVHITVLLSLIGVRVDVEPGYMNIPFNSPVTQRDGGPSSAFLNTPFHRYRDGAVGHHVHRKCPELEDYCTSRTLLHEVRALGSPVRFPTRLSAWLVHLEPHSAELQDAQGSEGLADGGDSSAGSRASDSDSHAVSCSPLGAR